MQTILNPARALWARSINTVLPARCVLTGELVVQQGMLSPAAWSALDFIADPLCDHCGIPFDFEVEDKSVCASCLAEPPPYTRARAALVYGEKSRDLILGFKHADKLHIVKAFSPWLMRAGQEMIKASDVIVPVPLHRWRMIARRYNQAALIAQDLGKVSGVSVSLEALKRVRSTPSQGHLDMKERARNVKRAFAVPVAAKSRIAGKTVLLVDDVYTTGSTVRECTNALLKAGASAVHVLALARVVRGNFE